MARRYTASEYCTHSINGIHQTCVSCEWRKVCSLETLKCPSLQHHLNSIHSITFPTPPYSGVYRLIIQYSLYPRAKLNHESFPQVYTQSSLDKLKQHWSLNEIMVPLGSSLREVVCVRCGECKCKVWVDFIVDDQLFCRKWVCNSSRRKQYRSSFVVQGSSTGGTKKVVNIVLKHFVISPKLRKRNLCFYLHYMLKCINVTFCKTELLEGKNIKCISI